MVEIVTDNGVLELDESTRIKFTHQISDIFNIAQVKATHTDSFSLPKTANNVKILKGLGLVGSTSNVPYEKISATIKYKGFDVIKKGWLAIKETTDRYVVNVIEGNIDFFKDIENINISDINLEEIDHSKDLQTIVDSFANENYRYIFGDYNGRNLVEDGIDVDYQVPSVRYKYLIDKIFSHFGWTKGGGIFSEADYLDSWITYPKAPEPTNVVVAKMNKDYYVDTNPVLKSGTTYVFNDIKSWDSSEINEGILVGNWSYAVPETNKYSIKIRSKGFFTHIYSSLPSNSPWFNPIQMDTVFFIQVYMNDVPIGQPLQVYKAEGQEYFTEYVGFIPYTSVITFKFIGYGENPISLTNEFTEVTISRVEEPYISFTEGFSNFKVKDFLNEFMRRFGLTMMANNDTKHVTFYSFEDRIDKSSAVDWSEKFIRRTKETYVTGSYAQLNYYKHKYINDNEVFNDGVIVINNKNLPAEKTLFTSPFYSRTDRVSLDFTDTFVHPIWERNPKESDSGEISVDYTGLTGMWYVVKQTMRSAPDTKLISNVGAGGQIIVNEYPVITSDNTHYLELVPLYYDGYNQLLNSCKVHEMEFDLNELDRLKLDLTKPIYVLAEASFYILNKVVFESGKPAKVEGIRINES